MDTKNEPLTSQTCCVSKVTCYIKCQTSADSSNKGVKSHLFLQDQFQMSSKPNMHAAAIHGPLMGNMQASHSVLHFSM